MNANKFKPLRLALGVLWLGSALLPLLPEVQERAMQELQRFGFSTGSLYVLMFSAMALDMVCAFLAVCVRRPWAWLFQMAVVLTYTLLLSFSHAALWLDPFGALLKNIPIVAAMWVLWQVDREEQLSSVNSAEKVKS